uniref:IQ motif containing with AAA domain 1 n=1 Tax=Stegastes partitus TaxID=144197 RepID=A0A3B4ZVS1_9TELE
MNNVLMFNQLWADAQLELSRLLAEELPAEPLRPEKDRVVFFQRLATLYVRYVRTLRQLQEAYDLMVHPQKRRLIRRVLDSVVGRVLELKNEMVEKEFSEYHYMDDVLHDLKLSPAELEIPIPRYFLSERSKELISKLLSSVFLFLWFLKPLMSPEEAIRLIQLAERARQGRLRAKLNAELRSELLDTTKAPGPADTELAAICIQKVWRGYIARKRTKAEREEEMIFLGMVSEMSHFENSCTRAKQEEYEEAYQKSMEDVTKQLRDMEGHDMSKTMKDQIRQWFIECRNATGVFPDYPDEEDGGSALIFAEKRPQQVKSILSEKHYWLHTFRTYFWQTRDESENFSQRHEVELVKEEMRKVMKAEIQMQVLLAAQHSSLCQELVEQGLLKQAHHVRLHHYLGDYSYLGTTLRQNDIEPMPSLADVRQVLSLYAVLPLGSQLVHEKAPLIKAMLLAGPSGVGKKMLVHAVCQETGSTMFDLSPLNTAGKYPGKSGVAMMLHLVFKVARLLQPSVIWIDDAEKMFYKKVPKEEKELDPKRLQKDLLKSLKLIKAEDRVLIMGTTKDPLSTDMKSLCKMYSKIILIPRPDYGSRYILWKQLIKKQGGEVTKALDLSSLAKITDGYTPGHMVKAIHSVVTKWRILVQPDRPLTAAEFIPPLAKTDPVFQEEEEALKNWYAKTPLGKKRMKAAAGKEEEEAAGKGKAVKNKKTNKKKKGKQ